MDFPTEQLQTFKAVIEAGTLESAARQLNVTASAVSQRLKALERQAGSVLFIRSRPIRTTASGDVLLRLARQIHMLSAEAHRSLGLDQAQDGRSHRAELSIAVNADSLASWFTPVLGALAAQDLMACEILRHDEAHSTELLRSGEVMGTVTTKSTPVQGCSSVYLGSMRYRAMASASFKDQWFPGVDPEDRTRIRSYGEFRPEGRLATGTAPEESWAARPEAAAIEHFVPDSRVYVAAVGASLGWGMVPEVQEPGDGSLVCLDPAWTSDVRLFWQRWKVPSPALDLLTTLVLDAADAAGLHHDRQ